jgi:hypothetical protein
MTSGSLYCPLGTRNETKGAIISLMNFEQNW